MAARGLVTHLLLFAGASVLALRSWTAEEAPAEKHSGVELWSGRTAAVSRVDFSTDKKRLLLEPKSDEQGGYYVATVTTVPTDPEPKGDAGAPVPSAEPASSPPKRFISVKRGEELVEALASLRATRVLGKVDAERLGEYGFDEEGKGKLSVTVDGTAHALSFGDKTPGGRDRYVRDPNTGLAYVIAGQVANDLSASENRLIERSFHDFGEDTVARVRIKKGESGRELVVHPTEKDFWSNPESPDAKDETASNWMTKVDRLRVTTYLEEPEVKPEDRVVRIDYINGEGKELGFFELFRLPPEAPGKKVRYIGRSERTRWYATVLRSTAEQVEEDLATLLSP